MKVFKWLLLCGMIVCLSFTSYSQLKDTGERVDSFIRQAMKDRHIPGLALAVVKNGKLVKESYYGIANLEHNIPVTQGSVFEIASMTKQFTCAAILLLQQEKKLSVDDKLSKFLDSLPVAWQDITLRQLMSHTAGLRDDWDERTDYFLENHSNQKMLKAQKSYPLRFHPGEGYTYSSGPFDLGLVIEKVSGKSYPAFMKEKIFDPLGMSASSIYDNRRIVPGRVAGYIWNDSVQTGGYDIAPAAEARADVGMLTSLGDMIKWDLALRSNRLLSEQSRTTMFSPARLNGGHYIGYGLGWFVYPMFGVINYDHGGGFRTGFNSDILRIDGKDLDIIILANQWYAGAGNLVYRIAALYDSSIHLMTEASAVTDPDPARTKLLSGIIRHLAEKKWGYEELYRQYNFCGADPNELQGLFKDFKELQYISEENLQKKPIGLYGEELTKIVYYKTLPALPYAIAFYYNRAGKLVAINYQP